MAPWIKADHDANIAQYRPPLLGPLAGEQLRNGHVTVAIPGLVVGSAADIASTTLTTASDDVAAVDI